MRLSLALGFSSLLFISPSVFAQFNAEQLNNTVEKALMQFHTPGMSVAVVHNGAVVYEKGFGLADIETQQAVTENTYFRLASTSKAFTAAAVAILVDESRINWNDLVIDYLPQFRLQDTYATRHFTVEDLLTHKSGLLNGAGDSMIWPEPSGFSRDEVIANLRYLTPDYQFRQTYAYSNVMYITAGELVAKVSGKSFEDFVDQHIFKPLGMQCFAGDMPEKAVAISAMSYGHNDAKGIYAIPRNAIDGNTSMSAAAGNIVCNANNMAKWLQSLLAPQTLPFSAEQLDKMWQGHTLLSVSETDQQWNSTHFKSYGLGWRMENIGAYKLISHTGTLSGYQAYVALIPELNVGAVVLNNGSNYGARGAVMQTILKMFTDSEQADWVQAYIDYQDEREQAYLARASTPEATAKMSLTSDSIVGTYRDPWFGDLILTKQDGKIRIHSARMATLTGELEPFQDATFKIVWDNQNAASDAFMHFILDTQRSVLSAKLHPFSTSAVNNHEWRDMHFIKVHDK